MGGCPLREKKLPLAFWVFAPGFEAPRRAQNAVESPFKEFNHGAYYWCENQRLPWRAGTPSQKIPVFHFKITGICSKIIPVLTQTQLFIF